MDPLSDAVGPIQKLIVPSWGMIGIIVDSVGTIGLKHDIPIEDIIFILDIIWLGCNFFRNCIFIRMGPIIQYPLGPLDTVDIFGLSNRYVCV